MVFGFLRKKSKEESREAAGNKDVSSSPTNSDRYANQKLIPEIGEEGQEKLKKAKIMIIGCGGIGTSAAQYLAAAGVGKIGLIDNDYIDVTDIQRQPIYKTNDVGKRKAFVLADRLKEINPEAVIVPNSLRLRHDNAMKMLKDYDIVIDSSNNMPTHYLLGDSCVLLSKPDIFASASVYGGRITVFDAKRGPCHRCIFPDPSSTKKEDAMIGPAAGLIGIVQAAEAMNLILGNDDTLIGRMLSFSLMDMHFYNSEIKKNEDCAICGKNPAIKELVDYDEFCGTKAKPQPAALIFNKEKEAKQLDS